MYISRTLRPKTAQGSMGLHRYSQNCGLQIAHFSCGPPDQKPHRDIFPKLALYYIITCYSTMSIHKFDNMEAATGKSISVSSGLSQQIRTFILQYAKNGCMDTGTYLPYNRFEIARIRTWSRLQMHHRIPCFYAVFTC